MKRLLQAVALGSVVGTTLCGLALLLTLYPTPTATVLLLVAFGFLGDQLAVLLGWRKP